MRLMVRFGIIALACLVLLPATVFAQASISGAVRDASGAVLPGVTVEAASPALIEKVRSVVTDGGGQYRIIDLRPGAYTVTFTLPGFNTVKREGVELTGSFAATVNADLTVGSVEETITVTGESAIVDVQSATRERVMNSEVADAIPTGRLVTNLAVLIPGMTPMNATGGRNQDVGGSLGSLMVGLVIHGSRNTDQRIAYNGISLGTLATGGSVSFYVPNLQAVQEVSIDYAAVSAEMDTGGVRINMIPKDGGNSFKGTIFASYANDKMQGDNFTQRVKDLGLRTPDSLLKAWDLNPGLGGPIKKDRVWFYTTVRYNGNFNNAGGIFVNKNANNPNAWTYEPTTEPAANKARWRDGQARVTWQANSKNKLAFVYDYQVANTYPNGIAFNRSPETGVRRGAPVQPQYTADWQAPLTSRVLLDAVVTKRYERYGSKRPFLDYLADGMISVTEQSTGLQYRSLPTYSNSQFNLWYYRVGMSYVTGTHSFRVGFNDGIGDSNTLTYLGTPPVSYRFNNGVPNQITLQSAPTTVLVNMDHQGGLYAQDKWSLPRLTIGYGVRYDFVSNSFPEQYLGPTELTPARNITIPASKSLSWKDITPKLSATYDPFGNAKTAIKVSLNKYVAAQTTGAPVVNPITQVATTTTRSWNDANRNYVPECDLVNPVANGECGAMANSSFGKLVPASAVTDPELLNGWGKRGYNWEFSAGIQRELIPRLSVDVGYFRRWYGNFIVTDNLAVAASDYDKFSLAVPTNPKLPDGGGNTLTGLYNLNPSKFGVPSSNFTTLTKNYGKQLDHWNGVDINVNARMNQGLLVQGGVSIGKFMNDNCEVAAKVPEVLFSPPLGFTSFGLANATLLPADSCHIETPFLSQAKAIATYTIPHADVLVSMALQSTHSNMLLSNYNAPNALVAPSLGRPLSGNAANVTVSLIKPGEVYGERINQLDLRFGKILKSGGTKASLNLDLYNVFNSDTVLLTSPEYAAIGTPTQILTARFAKFSVQFDF